MSDEARFEANESSCKRKALVVPGWLSCILNRNLCQKVRNYLSMNGIELCSSIHSADIIIFSGCGVTVDTELQSLAELSYLQEKVEESQDEKRVVLIGCFPKQNPKTRGAHYDSQGIYREKVIDSRYVTDPNSKYIVVDNYDYSVLDALISAKIPFNDVPNPSEIPSVHGAEGVYHSFKAMKGYPISRRVKLQQNFVQQAEMQNKIETQKFFYPTVAEFLASYGYQQIIIGQGCKNNCAYCAIKFARTKLKSIPPKVILAQIKSLVDQGQTKFVLLCQDLRSWGMDLKLNWIDLIQEILQIDSPDLRLALFNARIEDILEEKAFFDRAVATGKLTYIGAMGQHVNEEILSAMKRQVFPKEDFLELINTYGEKNVHIHTYNIIGFPGETEQAFNELVDFVRGIKTENFSLLNFPYSDRKGTLAYTYDDKIPLPVIMDRINRINEAYIQVSQDRFSHFSDELRQALNGLIQLQAEHAQLLRDFEGYLSDYI